MSWQMFINIYTILNKFRNNLINFCVGRLQLGRYLRTYFCYRYVCIYNIYLYIDIPTATAACKGLLLVPTNCMLS